MAIGTLINVGLSAPDAISKGKEIKIKQQEKRLGTNLPGGAPPMRKVSSRAALNLKQKLMDKQAAGIPEPFGVGKALLVGAGLAGGGIIAGKAAQGVSGAFVKFKSERMFKELERRYPEIRRHKEARKYFDLIIAYAPSLLRHHAAVGDFLRRQLEYPMSSVEFIKQLADLEGTVSKTEGNSAASQFGRDVTQQAPYGFQAKI